LGEKNENFQIKTYNNFSNLIKGKTCKMRFSENFDYNFVFDYDEKTIQQIIFSFLLKLSQNPQCLYDMKDIVCNLNDMLICQKFVLSEFNKS